MLSAAAPLGVIAAMIIAVERSRMRCATFICTSMSSCSKTTAAALGFIAW